MTATESVLQMNPDFGQKLLGLMGQCQDLHQFGLVVMQSALNALMGADADKTCGAPYGTRSSERENFRNGYRQRELKTTLGDITLQIPKLRHGTYYPETILSRWNRVETSLAALVVEAYTNGVSTRDMSQLAQALGISSLSSSDVSRLTVSLDTQVSELRSRDLGLMSYCYLWIDATYVKCRVDGKSVSQAFVTAIALGEDGYKHVVGLDLVDTESYDDWKAFLASLKARGLKGLALVVSDNHSGLVRALAEVFQGVAWQRCTVHLQRNISDAVTNKADEKVVRELVKATFAQEDPLLLNALYRKTTSAIKNLGQKKAARILEEAQECALQYSTFPQEHWKRIRTNNVQERANREIKRRYRSVQCFPSRESLMRLIGAIMLEEDEAWQTNRVFNTKSTSLAWQKPAIPKADGDYATRIQNADKRAEEIVQIILDRYITKE